MPDESAAPVQRRRSGGGGGGGRRLFRFFGEILQASGVGERMLQRWIDAGIIRPIGHGHSGRGNYRMFDAREIVLAVLLRPLADAGIPLGRLLQISRILRHAMRQRPPRREPEDNPQFRIVRALNFRYQELGQAIRQATAGAGINFAILAVAGDNVHPGALSAETGELPTFNPAAFLVEAAEYAAMTGEPPSPTTLMMLDLAPLRGLLD